MRAAAVAVAIAIGVVAPARALADDDDKPIFHKMRFIERGDQLTVLANPSPLAKLFDSASYGALASGFTSTVVIRIWIYPRDGNEPVAYQQINREVVYNLWDEVFELRSKEPGRTRVFKEKRQSEVLKWLTALDEVPVALLSTLPYENVFQLAMQVELNPVDQATLAEVRRWLSQGTGGGLDRGGAFFGSFVSVFVNPKIPEADRVLRVRSQPFYRPKPP
jgi:hypothetical protein